MPWAPGMVSLTTITIPRLHLILAHKLYQIIPNCTFFAMLHQGIWLTTTEHLLKIHLINHKKICLNQTCLICCRDIAKRYKIKYLSTNIDINSVLGQNTLLSQWLRRVSTQVYMLGPVLPELWWWSSTVLGRSELGVALAQWVTWLECRLYTCTM